MGCEVNVSNIEEKVKWDEKKNFSSLFSFQGRKLSWVSDSVIKGKPMPIFFMLPHFELLLLLFMFVTPEDNFFLSFSQSKCRYHIGNEELNLSSTF